jgi:hypothetical protein
MAKKRMFISGLLAAIVIGAATLLLSAPASATSQVTYLGNNWGRVIDGNTGSDEIIVVCDGEADGNIVWVNYDTDRPVTGMRLEDRTGANDGCHWHNMQGTPYRITRFQLCEGSVCTGWRVRGTASW